MSLSLHTGVWVAVVATAVTVVRDSSLHRAPHGGWSTPLSAGTAVAALTVLPVLNATCCGYCGTAVLRYVLPYLP